MVRPRSLFQMNPRNTSKYNEDITQHIHIHIKIHVILVSIIPSPHFEMYLISSQFDRKITVHKPFGNLSVNYKILQYN